MSGEEVVLRCPTEPRRTFGRLNTRANTLEVACRRCKEHRRKDGEEVLLVTHTFGPAGDVQRTVVYRQDQEPEVVGRARGVV